MKSSSPDVIFGKDGWLFLGAGSNDFMPYLEGRATLPQVTLEAWGRLLTSRQRWFENKGIRYVHVFAPEKVTVYPSYYPHAVDTSFGHISTLSRHCARTFLNVLHYFNKIKHKYRLYDKTDTHWNRVGAFACYQLICSVLGYRPMEDLLSGPRMRINALYDLGMKLEPAMQEEVEIVQRPRASSRVFANVLVRFKERNDIENEVGLHIGSRAVFRNQSARYQGKVVIFGDSFSEYRPDRLTEMFAETFAEVHFCWSPDIDFNYVKHVQPELVISELCERFVVQVPSDQFVVDRFARNRLVAFLEKRSETGAETARKQRPHHKSRGSATPRLVLHIGPHKTGTTYMQKIFADRERDLLESGILYPVTGRDFLWGHHSLASRLVVNDAAILDRLASEISSYADIHTVLLSSENFSTLSTESLESFKNAFDGYQFELVYLVRRCSTLLYSSWQEEIKHGSTELFPEYALRHILGPYASDVLNYRISLDRCSVVFGKSAIQIAVYDQLRNLGVDLASFVTETILRAKTRIKVTGEEINKSFDPVTVELLRGLNACYAQGIGKPTFQLKEDFFRALSTGDSKLIRDVESLRNVISPHLVSFTLEEAAPVFRAIYQDLRASYGDRVLPPSSVDQLILDEQQTEIEYCRNDYSHTRMAQDLYREILQRVVGKQSVAER